MEVEHEENAIEAATDEEFAAKYADVLIKAMIETAAETEVPFCQLSDSIISSLVFNLQKNGHGPCANQMMVRGSLLLLQLEEEDAKEPRH